MTEALPTIAKGDTYFVVFQGGPNDGQSDSRISTDGSADAEITVITAVDGKETMLDYVIESWSEVGGECHVVYTFDAKDSEPVSDPEDRADRQ